jgi:hypothetical protein
MKFVSGVLYDDAFHKAPTMQHTDRMHAVGAWRASW